jgi:hypothetical protein
MLFTPARSTSQQAKLLSRDRPTLTDRPLRRIAVTGSALMLGVGYERFASNELLKAEQERGYRGFPARRRND